MTVETTSSLDWLDERTILRVRHGSHAYGTSIEGSDLDIRGVAVAPAKYHLGYLHQFEQSVRTVPDVTIFGLQKFCKLAADGNPNALELLFVDESDVLHTTEHGARLLEHRGLFLSRKLKHTLSGYAHAQLKRIKTHRRWLLHPPSQKPTREQFDLPERTVIPKDQIATATSLVQRQIEEWDSKLHVEGIDDATRIAIATAISEMSVASDEKFRAAGRVIGLSENFLQILDRERAYSGAKAEWSQYESWKATRNPARYELEAKHGYDTKHGMHLVRLMRSCLEVLATGRLNVRRADAAELLEVRAGLWSFDRLVAYAESMSEAIEEADRTTSLPKAPRRVEIDAMCVEITRAML